MSEEERLVHACFDYDDISLQLKNNYFYDHLEINIYKSYVAYG